MGRACRSLLPSFAATARGRSYWDWKVAGAAPRGTVSGIGGAQARELGCRAGSRTQGDQRIGPSATPIPLAWSPFGLSGTRRKRKSPPVLPAGFGNLGRVLPSASTAVATGYCQAVAAGIRRRVEARQPQQAVRPSAAIVAEPTQEAIEGFHLQKMLASTQIEHIIKPCTQNRVHRRQAEPGSLRRKSWQLSPLSLIHI